MHHSRVQSLTSEDQDHHHDYSDESSIEASSPKRRKVSASWVNVSCQLCKTRKVKCDRTLPSCGWCTRNNAVCEYKERKKPGLRAGYGRELEQRLDKLEGVLLRHEDMLTRALEEIRVKSFRSSYADERTWSQPLSTGPAEAPYTFPPRESDYAFYSSSPHRRTESTNNQYPSRQRNHDFAPSLPPVKAASIDDRRPSVTFMNNPTSPSSNSVKLSASQSPSLAHSILKATSTSLQSQYAPLPTPDTSNNSSSHSPQHVQDYLSHRPSLHSSSGSDKPLAQRLRQQYPLPESCKNYTDEILPPWEVMYDLSIIYLTTINLVLPLISETTVLDAVLDPHKLKGEETAVRSILMAITVVTMRFFPPGYLTATEQERCVKKCRAALASSTVSKTKEGTQALAVLLLGSNGQMNIDEAASILSQVNGRLWQEESMGGRKPLSPLSLNEMLCGP